MMLLQDYFKYFDIWSAIESGLYYIVVGYLVLIFFYFLLMRYRTSKRFYWLYFSFLFLFLAIGRFFFIVYYFYAPELNVSDPIQIVSTLMIYYRLATFSTWLGIACLMGVLGILIFPPLTDIPVSQSGGFKGKIQILVKKKYVRVALKSLLIIIPIFVAIAALFMPDALLMDPKFADDYGVNPSFFITIFGYPVGRALLNFVLLPIFVAIIPFLYIYLATRTFGVLRRSYALNAIGFLIYFLGRILDGLFGNIGWPHVDAVVPPLLILLSLLIIVIANNYEQLK